MDICLMSLDDLGSIFGEQFVDTQLQSWEDTPLRLLICTLKLMIFLNEYDHLWSIFWDFLAGKMC